MMGLAPEDAREGAGPPPRVTEGLCEVTAPDGSLWLAVVAKRTYAWSPRRLALADAQEPLVPAPDVGLDATGAPIDLLDDTDLCASKPFTDVVVRGSARLDRPARRRRAGVAIGRSRRVVEFVGPRRVCVDARSRVRFTDPEPFELVALGAREAYGGHDAHAQLLLDPECATAAERGRPDFVPEPLWPFAYPRNAAGRGYFVDIDRRRADGARLPSVEDPADPLEPRSFFVADPVAWAAAPVPGLLGWIPHGAYPRAARYLGPLAHADATGPRPREAAFADGQDLLDPRPLPGQQAHPRCLQGAAPGLAAERLRGDELVVLEGLVPEAPRLEFHLPGEAPRLEVLVPELGSFKLERALQTVRVDLDRRTVSLTWSGALRLVAKTPPEFLETCVQRVALGRA